MKNFVKTYGTVCTVLGAQWGDEGKGKLVDILAEQYGIVVRATGGANAGHTIYLKEKKFVFHLVPSGLLHPKTIGVIGNGMVVHLPTLWEEIEALQSAGIKILHRLFISDRAHLVFDYHRAIDQKQEELKGKAKIGTTGRGIGPAYADKCGRIGIRAGELRNFAEFSRRYRANCILHEKLWGISLPRESELAILRTVSRKILPCIIDTSAYIHGAIARKIPILIEGANGTLLDIDHGTYPFLTSSNAAIGGVISGTGIAPRHLRGVIGVFKAYQTRVGSGPFPTELTDKIGDELRELGGEYGSTTGRPRRCGWFDAVAARYAIDLNGFTNINLTKVDVLNHLKKIRIGVCYRNRSGRILSGFPADGGDVAACTVQYEELPGWKSDISKIRLFGELPPACRAFILKLEKKLGVKISSIGVGKERDAMIFRE